MIDIRTFFRKNRRLVSGLGMILAVLLIFWSVSSPAIVGVSASQRSLPVYSVERGDKCVSLSFDAAWGNEDTQTLIDILSGHGVKATFFVVGDWAEKYPESVKALAEAGNEVMNHSSDHAHFSSLSTEQILSDLSACNEKVAALTGVAPSLFRCPYGEYDDHVIQAVESLGMTAVQWDVDSLDWKGISASEITDRVLQNVRSGSIVLFHNAAIHTPEALPGIIEALQKEGYTIVPVSQLLLQGDTYQDNTGRQWAR
jgi:polysaccharide deacetylase family sporulation protein PdaB